MWQACRFLAVAKELCSANAELREAYSKRVKEALRLLALAIFSDGSKQNTKIFEALPNEYYRAGFHSTGKSNCGTWDRPTVRLYAISQQVRRDAA